VADPGQAEGLPCDASDRHDPAASRELADERAPRIDLGSRRGPVRIGAPSQVGMGRDGVPEEHLVHGPELGENAVDDRRSRFGRACAGQLALGRERNPGNPGAAIPGRLADEQKWRTGSFVEVGAKPVPAHVGPLTGAVEVERSAEVRSGEARDEHIRLQRGVAYAPVARYELQGGEHEIIDVKPSMARLFLLLVCTLFLYLPWFLVRIVQNRFTKWVVTNRRLISMSGVFNQTTISTGLERIQDVHYIRTLGDRIIGTGSIEVESAAEGAPVRIGFIRQDAEFRDALLKAIDQRQHELRERSAQGGI
jgi:Bacterial PH domain